MVKKSGRDEFKASVKRQIRDASSGLCCFPSCHALTAALSRNGKNTVVGQACHITAASPGGPRFDETLTSEGRASAVNGIWMCNNHAKQIDSDPESFPVEMLQRWKEECRDLAYSMLGNRNRVLGKDEIFKQYKVGCLPPKGSLATAMELMRADYMQSLECMDPRWQVLPTRPDSMSSFELRPRERINLKLVVRADSEEAFKLDRLYRDGMRVELPTSLISIEGSDLIESLITESQGSGVFVIEPVQHECIVKWERINQDGLVIALEPLKGSITSGASALRVYAEGLDGVLSLEITGIAARGTRKPSVSIGVETSRWNDVPVNRLPFFKKFHDAFGGKLADGYTACIELKGEEVFRGLISLDGTTEALEAWRFMAELIERTRTITSFTGQQIRFQSTFFGIDNDAWSSICIASDVLRNGKADASNMKPSLIEIVCTDADSLKNAFKEEIVIGEIRATLNDPEDVSVFGQSLELPKLAMKVPNARLEIKGLAGLADLKNGDSIKINVSPNSGSEAWVRLDDGQDEEEPAFNI